jgi:hypothetical protein
LYPLNRDIFENFHFDAADEEAAQENSTNERHLLSPKEAAEHTHSFYSHF